MSVKEVMTRFAFKCLPIKPLRPVSKRSIALLRAGHEILTKYGPVAYREFKRLTNEAGEFERVMNQMRDAARCPDDR